MIPLRAMEPFVHQPFIQNQIIWIFLTKALNKYNIMLPLKNVPLRCPLNTWCLGLWPTHLTFLRPHRMSANRAWATATARGSFMRQMGIRCDFSSSSKTWPCPRGWKCLLTHGKGEAHEPEEKSKMSKRETIEISNFQQSKSASFLVMIIDFEYLFLHPLRLKCKSWGGGVCSPLMKAQS